MQQPIINNIIPELLLKLGLSDRYLVRPKDLKAWEQESVKVNKFYTVACALVKDLGKPEGDSDNKLILIPVAPFLHVDKQFSSATAHYHIDGRFTNRDLNNRLGIEKGLTNTAVFMDKEDGDSYDRKKFIGIYYARFRCYRLTTGLDVIEGGYIPSKLKNWYKSMEGKSCEGKKCPHYGVQMLDRGTHLFCPMHNLVGCKTTNKILPYEQGFALENASQNAASVT